MSIKPFRLLWLDLETTGINPEEDLILEIYAELTNPNCGATFNFHQVIHHPQKAIDDLLKTRNRQKVLEMHTESGLLQEVRAADIKSTVESAQRALISLLPQMQYVFLAGSSIHFDRSFIKAQMPMLDTYLHYRMLDVSSICMMMNAKGIDVGDNEDNPANEDLETLKKKHRAREDVTRSQVLYLRAMEHVWAGR